MTQQTAFVTYGLTDRLDASLAVPVVKAELGIGRPVLASREPGLPVERQQRPRGRRGERRLTLAIDLVGRRVLDSPRVAATTFTGLDAAHTTFPDMRFVRGSFSEHNLSAGLELNPFGSLLVALNLQFKLDDAGLRDKLTPLVGIDYTF